MSKLISTFKIGFDDETKAEIAALKSSLDAITGTLGVSSALLGSTKPNGGLLVAMGEAANDALEPEHLELGQWVFEGQDAKWVSAAKDADSEVWLFQRPIKDLAKNLDDGYLLWYAQDESKAKYICDLRSNQDWQSSAIDRVSVNDVEYLSETSEINVMEASEIIIDEMGRDYSHNSNCLHAVVPEITQGDRQHIFIKNLSEVLIQRMYSMDRFSEDDCHIRELMPWDIVTGRNSFNDKQPNFAVVIAVSHIEHSDKSSFGIADLTSRFSLNQYVHTGQYVKITPSHNDTYRTITESELVWFRAALEACYV